MLNIQLWPCNYGSRGLSNHHHQSLPVARERRHDGLHTAGGRILEDSRVADRGAEGGFWAARLRQNVWIYSFFAWDEGRNRRVGEGPASCLLLSEMQTLKHNLLAVSYKACYTTQK